MEACFIQFFEVSFLMKTKEVLFTDSYKNDIKITSLIGLWIKNKRREIDGRWLELL